MMPIIDEYLDADGYPTDEALDEIRKWEIKSDVDYYNLMYFCTQLWTYKYFKKENEAYHFATMGWSGNESIITALEQNTIFWILYWALSERGGYYVFCPMSCDFNYRTSFEQCDEKDLELEGGNCGDCGTKLQIVRPGKWQCPECE